MSTLNHNLHKCHVIHCAKTDVEEEQILFSAKDEQALACPLVDNL